MSRCRRTFIDATAVERAVRGFPTRLNRKERWAAIDQVDDGGLRAADVAARIGCHPRTVARRRQARATTSPGPSR